MRRLAAVLAAGAALTTGSIAHAGVYADDLAKCVVAASSPSDQTQFVTFIFMAISAHPAIKSYSNITDAQRADAAKQAGAFVERLLTKDCRAQAVAALKYEGPSAVEVAFEVLGQVAARSLFTDPAVEAMMNHVNDDRDASKIADLYKEAGLPAPK
jgi:hypothetical protein